MRLKITLQLDRTATIPADHQHELQALIYDFLNRSSPEFARFLHDEGYATGTPNGDTRRFKAFVFSGLRVHRSRRRLANGGLTILPGTVDWFLSSPKEEFVRHLATGLLSRGGHLRIAQTRFEIVQAAALPTPEFREREEYVCLSPLVAAVPTPDGKGTRYLLPSDGEAFSNAIRCNLLRKYAALNGGASEPADPRLRLDFSPKFLNDPARPNTKLVDFKGIKIKGAFAPFTLTAAPELHRLAYEAGLGEKNSGGFGMIAMSR